MRDAKRLSQNFRAWMDQQPLDTETRERLYNQGQIDLAHNMGYEPTQRQLMMQGIDPPR